MTPFEDKLAVNNYELQKEVLPKGIIRNLPPLPENSRRIIIPRAEDH